MTGALKNTFGAVVGGEKAALHIRYPDAESFGRMIADVNSLVPSRWWSWMACGSWRATALPAGDLVDLGLLLISTDPVAVDAVACAILGIEPLSLPFLRAASEAGLGARAGGGDRDPRRAALRVDGAAASRCPPAISPTVPPALWRVARSLFIGKPVIDAEACVACGECVASCPTSPKSLAQERGKVPCYSYASCIRCYCCQETCPQGAISVRAAPLARLLEGRPGSRRPGRDRS